MEYKKYLAELVELTKKINDPQLGGVYPKTMNTPGKRALYDNLGKDESLVLAVHEAVSKAQDNWRGNPFKIKMVRNALKAILNDDEKTNTTLELVKNQHEY